MHYSQLSRALFEMVSCAGKDAVRIDIVSCLADDLKFYGFSTAFQPWKDDNKLFVSETTFIAEKGSRIRLSSG